MLVPKLGRQLAIPAAAESISKAGIDHPLILPDGVFLQIQVFPQGRSGFRSIFDAAIPFDQFFEGGPG